MDLLDFFRGKYSWGKLERLVSRLASMPRSHYQLAIAEDDEVAEQMLDDADDAGDGSPPLSMWTPEVQYLAAVVDRLGEVIATTIAAAGGKPPKVKPLPRPRTAFDRARARRALSRHESLVAEMEAARARR